MTVLITDTGRVEQRVIDVAAPLDEVFLGELRSKLNTALAGLGAAGCRGPPRRRSPAQFRTRAPRARRPRSPSRSCSTRCSRTGRTGWSWPAPRTSRAPRRTSPGASTPCSRRSRSRSRCSSCSARWRPTTTASRSSIGRENDGVRARRDLGARERLHVVRAERRAARRARPDAHGLLEQHGGGARRRPLPHPLLARRELATRPSRHPH